MLNSCCSGLKGESHTHDRVMSYLWSVYFRYTEDNVLNSLCHWYVSSAGEGISHAGQISTSCAYIHIQTHQHPSNQGSNLTRHATDSTVYGQVPAVCYNICIMCIIFSDIKYVENVNISSFFGDI